jgi:sulfite reductase (NADPH) flavoprotein alpha-component
VIDLLESEKRRMSEEELLSLLRPLAPRYYSIASSRKAVPDEAHLLIASVRYQAHGRVRNGVASMDVVERRKPGDRMPVWNYPGFVESCGLGIRLAVGVSSCPPVA